jgi:Tfp pilus assembly protein PilZ
MDPSDKRKSVRVPVRIEAQIERSHHAIPATILNCSIDGMFVRTIEMIPDNEAVKISFVIPGTQQEMILPSRAIWCHSMESTGTPVLGLGIRFEQVTPEHAETLREFINQILNS